MFKTLGWIVLAVVSMVAGWEAKRHYMEHRPRIVKALQAAKSAWLDNTIKM
jgi:hypothetical protein